MRMGSAALGLGCLALVVVACGGNVVVDGATAASGGSVGSAGATTTGSGGAAAACTDVSGEALSNGGCQTDATCSGNPIFIQCNPGGTGGGSTCICEVNSNQVGTCNEAPGSVNVCNPTNGCCASLIGG
jgi:hypothetical protein